MPALFVPEEQWAPQQLGGQPPPHVRADEHGLEDAATATGASPHPARPRVATAIRRGRAGLNPEGYSSNEAKTYLDPGFGDCRAGTTPPRPTPTAS